VRFKVSLASERAHQLTKQIQGTLQLAFSLPFKLARLVIDCPFSNFKIGIVVLFNIPQPPYLPVAIPSTQPIIHAESQCQETTSKSFAALDRRIPLK
jgi:hypothetical protein